MGGVANAINIIDGFNGLAAGSLIIMFASFAWVAHQVGDDLVFGLAILYGALVLGFFLVNFPLGKIFLGDGGAYFAGFLLAALGVLLPMRNPETSAWTAILICAYPVIETLASMRRKQRRDGHSVGQPDRVHFHMLAHRRYARPHRQGARGRCICATRRPASSPGRCRILTGDLRGHRLRQRAGERLLLLRHGVHLRPALPGDVAERPEPAPRPRAAALATVWPAVRRSLIRVDSRLSKPKWPVVPRPRIMHTRPHRAGEFVNAAGQCPDLSCRDYHGRQRPLGRGARSGPHCRACARRAAGQRDRRGLPRPRGHAPDALRLLDGELAPAARRGRGPDADLPASIS